MSAPRMINTSDWIRFPGYSAIQPFVERVSGINGINQIYRSARREGTTTGEFCTACLERLGVSMRIEMDEAVNSAQSLLVLGNHPTGMIESLMMVDILERLNPGRWKMLTNQMIHASPEFRDCSIPLDPFGLSDDPRFNIRGFMAAKRHLHDNGIIGGFPAGRVAPCYGPNAMPCDSRWSPHLVRLARLTGAGVLIASFSLSSGRLLRFLPASIPHLRGLFLAREALRPAHRRQIAVRVATAPETSGLSDEETTAVLQRFCHEHLHS